MPAGLLMNPYIQVLDTLDKAFDHFNDLYCEGVLKKPIIVILSRGRKKCLGWHWSHKWSVKEEVLPEIMVAAETLNRPKEQILETLLHEMVHLYNAQQNLKDCNSQQYHNKHFKKTAEQIFHLEVSRMPQKGWAITNLTEKSRTDVQSFCESYQVKDFNINRIAPLTTSSKRQYNISVDQEGYEWFKNFKEYHQLTSKESFSLLIEKMSEESKELSFI